jgi:hypothetical protein
MWAEKRWRESYGRWFEDFSVGDRRASAPWPLWHIASFAAVLRYSRYRAAPIAQKPLPGSQLWRDRRFLTLSAGMALGLFAQIGLIAHLFSLLVPALGAQLAGLAMGGATAAAIAGRTLVGWLMPVGADRRLVACTSYVVQIVGSIALLVAGGTRVPLTSRSIFSLVSFIHGMYGEPQAGDGFFGGDTICSCIVIFLKWVE